MFSKFNHTQCGRTCARAVACLYPHNSISNVVASVTIHDNMYICVRDVRKKHQTVVEGQRLFFNRTSWKVSDVQIVRYTWVLSLSLCLCLCVSVSVCCVLCVVVVEEG